MDTLPTGDVLLSRWADLAATACSFACSCAKETVGIDFSLCALIRFYISG